MRSRQQIEEQISGWEDLTSHERLQIELQLDIRNLLEAKAAAVAQRLTLDPGAKVHLSLDAKRCDLIQQLIDALVITMEGDTNGPAGDAVGCSQGERVRTDPEAKGDSTQQHGGAVVKPVIPSLVPGSPGDVARDVVATQPNVVSDIDVQRKHADRLRTLNLMAQVINELKPICCSGVLALAPQGVLNPLSERYLLNCRRRVPDLGVGVILTRDHSAQLEQHLHLKSCVHLSLVPLPDSFMLDFKMKHPEFHQLGQLDETAAKDWVTTAFAPHHAHVWFEQLKDGTMNFRLFTDGTFGKPKALWTNQQRGLKQVLQWECMRSVFE